jgi:hypothetical protein
MGITTSQRVIRGLVIMRQTSGSKKDSTTGIKPTAPWRLIKVKPLANYTLEVEFNDGLHGRVEISQLIHSPHAGVFSALVDIKIFNQVHLVHGVATWPGEIDLAPDAMHEEIARDGIWILK